MPMFALLLQLATAVTDGHEHPRGKLTVHAPDQCRTVRTRGLGTGTAEAGKPRCKTGRAKVPKPHMRPR